MGYAYESYDDSGNGSIISDASGDDSTTDAPAEVASYLDSA